MNHQKTVMIIDDDDPTCQFMTWALADEGYEVISVANGAEALKLLAITLPHIILLDLHMPGMGGGAFATAYRSLPVSQVPIIVCTVGDRQAALKIEAAAYLYKPFDLCDLLAAVKRHVDPASAGSLVYAEGQASPNLAQNFSD